MRLMTHATYDSVLTRNAATTHHKRGLRNELSVLQIAAVDGATTNIRVQGRTRKIIHQAYFVNACPKLPRAGLDFLPVFTDRLLAMQPEDKDVCTTLKSLHNDYCFGVPCDTQREEL